ncbi:MAG: VWA domain-containing protein [Mariprofundus sp.]|nr:VWA domain-containing protein [Mariprofundus sp.]
MACGLGAIILVFMILKHNVDQPSAETDLNQSELLQTDLNQLQAQNAALQQSISKLDADALAEMAKMSQQQATVAALNNQMKQTSDIVNNKKMQLSAVKDNIKKAPKAKTDDVVKNDRGGEENYIMGIKVEGRKIALLIDSSASMTDESLIQIIRRKNSSASNKQRGPKWQRTKRIVRWLLARAPKSSQLSVLAYNQSVHVLGGSNWLKARDANSIKQVYNDLDKLVPSGSTNLYAGLQKVAALRPTNIYVITDGLPTTGPARYSSLNPFSSCNSLLGKSNTISGACRVKLFRQSVNETAPKNGLIVNVILLPIEGDPLAAPEYWAWSAATGGLLISPAMSWP